MLYISLKISGEISEQKQVIPVQKDFSMANEFSDKQERYLWEQESSFPDVSAMERCLCARALGQSDPTLWPVVFDPYHQFEAYVRALSRSQGDNSEEGGVYAP